MTATEKRMDAFCIRHHLEYKWQPLRFDGRRAVIETQARNHHADVLGAARRLKGVRVDQWTCSDGGVWEGYIYLQDAAEAERINTILMAERERNEKWWMVYHDDIVSGKDKDTAIQHAESLYPTPKSV